MPSIQTTRCNTHSGASIILKYDWHTNDETHTAQWQMRFKATGRDIVYSLSNSAPFNKAAIWEKLANCWRTTGDIRDIWSKKQASAQRKPVGTGRD